jgi:hypothetical protein
MALDELGSLLMFPTGSIPAAASLPFARSRSARSRSLSLLRCELCDRCFSINFHSCEFCACLDNQRGSMDVARHDLPIDFCRPRLLPVPCAHHLRGSLAKFRHPRRSSWYFEVRYSGDWCVEVRVVAKVCFLVPEVYSGWAVKWTCLEPGGTV